MEIPKLFSVVRNWWSSRVPDDQPLVVSMDDTVLRKTGKKIPGTKYLRDPLSPPFRQNFVWGQRWLQINGILVGEGQEPVRSLPLEFVHAPFPQKPGKKATQAEVEAYSQAREKARLSRVGREHMAAFRAALDEDGARERTVWFTVDGSYTNKEVLSHMPERSVLIGRMRKDAALHYPPTEESAANTGRPRVYGEKAPTPEELRCDESVPWSTCPIAASGKMHDLDYKEMGPVKCRTFGEGRLFRVLVLRPMSYRPRKGAHLLYRQPAYLLCTDLKTPAQRIIQAYVYRWEIEVSFRDEKQLLGMSQAQLRSPESVQRWPAFVAATYGMLIAASVETYGMTGFPTSVPAPKWYREQRPRGTVRDFMRELRHEIWGQGLKGESFRDFAGGGGSRTTSEKLGGSVLGAVLYA